MSKRTKIWLITATACLLIGGVLFAGVMTMLDWNFKKLSTRNYETNEHTVSETYENIAVTSVTADISIVPSDGDRTTVILYEEENLKHSVSVKDNTLVIEVMDERKWYDHIGFSFDVPQITVSVPKAEYGTLSVTNATGNVEISQGLGFTAADISVTTGDIFLRASVTGTVKCQLTTGKLFAEELSAGALEASVTTGRITVRSVSCTGGMTFKVTTGDVRLWDVKCESLYSDGTTGDIEMKNVVAAGKLHIERSTGDVEFEACDGAELFLKTTTGDIEGTLLSEKMFHAESKTGEVEIPRSTTGGLCQVSTTTGDIEIHIR